MGLDRRNPDIVACEQQSCRPGWVFIRGSRGGGGGGGGGQVVRSPSEKSQKYRVS